MASDQGAESFVGRVDRFHQVGLDTVKGTACSAAAKRQPDQSAAGVGVVLLKLHWLETLASPQRSAADIPGRR